MTPRAVVEVALSALVARYRAWIEERQTEKGAGPGLAVSVMGMPSGV